MVDAWQCVNGGLEYEGLQLSTRSGLSASGMFICLSLCDVSSAETSLVLVPRVRSYKFKLIFSCV